MIHNKKFFKRISPNIRSKLLVSFSLVIIISVAFVTYFPIKAYSQRLESNSIKYSNQVISNYIGNINNYIYELERVTDSILYNFYIQRYLINNNSEENADQSTVDSDVLYSDLYQGSTDVLSNIIKLRSDISSIFILNNEGVSLYKSRYKNLDLSKVNQRVLSQKNEMAISDSKILYDIDDIDYFDDLFTTFSISRVLERYDGQGNLGIIHMDSNLSVFKELGDSIVLDDSTTLIVIDQLGRYIYHKPMAANLKKAIFLDSEQFAMSVINQSANHLEDGFFIENINNEDYHIVFQSIEETGWLVATITPHNTILSEVNEIRNSIILISLISLLIILLITYIIATRITKPIITLKKSMDLADHNQFNTMVKVTSNDEIGDLSASFNHMITRIKSLMDELVKEQAEKRNAEIKVLQDQINPHFLYNTLDTIIWMTETNDENTVPMIEALSQLFRISLSRGQEFITIQEELEHIRNYLYILKLRYLDKFEYDIHTDPLLLNHKIPKIILQPLIENAIYHGIKNISNKGHIQIDASISGDKIIISITDNGIGMDEETCKKLLNNEVAEVKQSGSGVGIRNVNQRIKLYFGEDYGLEYHSAQGHGTTVMVILPF